ncbi:hypothetical protein [Pelagibacterium halotolerans]|uniref:hypothetical protein n=1 Tax=Pelagibacterium halotolerans TaxID=531813 RepID=UPI00384F3057
MQRPKKPFDDEFERLGESRIPSLCVGRIRLMLHATEMLPLQRLSAAWQMDFPFSNGNFMISWKLPLNF